VIARTALLAVIAICGLYGSQIAYIHDGGVWLKPISGGQAKKLSSSGRCNHPRFSASGRYVSSECDGILWVFDTEDASRTRIGPGSGEWAPKSDRIAWTSASGSYLLSAGTGWRPGQRLAKISAHAWSGDETMLAGSRRLDKPPPIPIADLLFLIPVTEGPARLLTRKGGELSPVFWTAANDLVLTVNEGFSASVAADGLPLHAISSDGKSEFDLRIVMLSGGDMLSVAPDRERLAAAAGSDRNTFANKWIATYDFRSRMLRSLTSRDSVSSISPAWSADAQRIAYISSATAEMGVLPHPERRIWVMCADGSAKRQMTNDAGWSDEHPLWTNDQAILFCRHRDNRSGSVWMIRTDGDSPPRLVVDHIDFPGPEYYGYVEWTRVLDLSGPHALAPYSSTR
jgi:hypothetical protein